LIPSVLDRYDLENPDLRDKLPRRLEEVSGVTAISSTKVACVQDEDGIVFIYDLEQQAVTRKIPFGPDGDYEELVLAEDALFVLRSDGVLYELRDWSDQLRVTTHDLGIPARDSEGLGFDSRQRRLLIAPKRQPGAGRAAKNTRPVFAFDLTQKRLLPEPVFEFDVHQLRSFADARGLKIPKQRDKKGKKRLLRFLPASIAVHPSTREIFVLSGVDRVLASFARRGAVTGYALLDRDLFRQPEGIAFLPNGDMVVTNEGDGKKATLLRFAMQPRADSTPGRRRPPRD
jgi:hypothetical protein